MDTVDGYRCGPCPIGQTGDGHTCSYINACEPNPCYPGVRCGGISNEPFYRCGPCPNGMTGDGENCDDIDEVRGPVWGGLCAWDVGVHALVACYAQD